MLLVFIIRRRQGDDDDEAPILTEELTMDDVTYFGTTDARFVTHEADLAGDLLPESGVFRQISDQTWRYF
jgi:hypothetical protein